MHLKIQEIPKKWPIQRKKSVYIIRPRFNLKNGIPLLLILRDMLKIVQNRKEAKRAIHLKNILINGKFAKDEKHSVSLFDIIEIVPSKKHYRIELTNKKFDAREISAKESCEKTAKIINKKILKKKTTQINLSDGGNFISDLNCKINDSVLINLKNRKIEKCLPLKERASVVVFEGKHIGKTGTIKKINSEQKMAEIGSDGKDINVLIKQFMVVE